ncbi:MAG TPA: LD-carboxypeptidase [Candidatus Megaira endosymbiont of Nemacystus decipiens]|nr:LD-carboxypeptidase [Candidatus Megaera endosymbiont of Nemacystus decipiens]
MIRFNKSKDLVSIVAPSSCHKDFKGKIDIKGSFDHLLDIVEIFKSNGMNAIYDKNIFQQNELDYFAAPKEVRFSQLKNALETPEVKIISAFRGGYGLAEIVFDLLDVVPSGPKILIGFSDITSLHLLFNQFYNFPTIHGMVSKKFRYGRKEIFALLNSKINSHRLEAINSAAKQNNDAISCEVSGGNLSIICNMIGTKLSPKFKDKIVIIEDVGEPGYKVHRFLMHLYNANITGNAKAIIFADFTASDDLLEPSLNHFINNYLINMPVYKTSKIGHKDCYPFILGSQGRIANNHLVIKNPFGME